jgi:hypothetical protein
MACRVHRRLVDIEWSGIRVVLTISGWCFLIENVANNLASATQPA